MAKLVDLLNNKQASGQVPVDNQLVDMVRNARFTSPSQAVPESTQFTRDLADAGNSSFLGRNLTAGTYQAGSSLANALAAALQGVGADRVSQSVSEYANSLQDRATPYTMFDAGSLSDAQGVGGTLKYLAAQGVRQAPNIGATVGGALLAQRVGGGSAAAPYVGAFIPSAVLNTGQAYQETKDAGNPNAGLAFTAGALSGALDAIIPGAAVGTAARGFSGGAKDIFKAAGKASLIEAGTETAQEALTIGAGAAAGGTYTPEEITNRLIESGVVGGALGGVMGGAGAGVGRLRNNQASQQIQTDQSLNEAMTATEPPRPDFNLTSPGTLPTAIPQQLNIPGYDSLPVQGQLDLGTTPETTGTAPIIDTTNQMQLDLGNPNLDQSFTLAPPPGPDLTTQPLEGAQYSSQSTIPGYDSLPVQGQLDLGSIPENYSSGVAINSNGQLGLPGLDGSAIQGQLDLSTTPQATSDIQSSGQLTLPSFERQTVQGELDLQPTAQPTNSNAKQLTIQGVAESQPATPTTPTQQTDTNVQATKSEEDQPPTQQERITASSLGIKVPKALQELSFAEVAASKHPSAALTAKKMLAEIIKQHDVVRKTDINQELAQSGMDLGRAQEAGTIQLHNSLADAPLEVQAAVGGDTKTQAAYVNGVTHIFSSSIPDGNARSVVLHDVGVHGGIARTLGEQGMQGIVTTLGNIERRGTPAARNIIQAAKQSLVEAGIDQTNPAYNEELLGYVVEYTAKSSENMGGLKKLASQAFTSIKQGLQATGLNVDITPTDVYNMAQASTKRALSAPEFAAVSSTLPTLRSVRTTDATSAPRVEQINKAVVAVGSGLTSLREVANKAVMGVLQADGVLRHFGGLFEAHRNDTVMADALRKIGIDPSEESAPRRYLNAASEKAADESKNWSAASLVLGKWEGFKGMVTLDGVNYSGKDAISAAAYYATTTEVNLESDNSPQSVSIRQQLGDKGMAIYREALTTQKKLRENLLAAYEVNAARNGVDATTLATQRSMLNSKLGGDYFSLQRTGDYFVEVYSTADDKVVFFAGADTRAQAETMAKKLSPAEGESIVVRQRSDMIARLTGGSKDFSTLMRMVDETNTGDATRVAVMNLLQDLIIQSAQSTSSLKAFAKRKNVAGSDVSSIQAAFAKQAVASSRLTAHFNHDFKVHMALVDAQNIVKNLPRELPADYKYDAVRAQQVVDTLAKARADDINYTSNWADRMVSKGSRLASAWFLSDVSYFINNLLQTPTVTLPYLMAQHGAGKAYSAMKVGYQTMTKLLSETGVSKHPLADILPIDGTPVNPQLAEKVFGSDWKGKVQLLNALQASQKIDSTFTHEVLSYSTGDINDKSSALFKLASLPGHASEITNRIVTALTVYELNKGMTADQIYAKAAKALDDTQGNYSRANRALISRSAFGRMVAQFQSFSVNQTSLLVKNITDSFNGKLSPEEVATARRTVGYMMMSYFMTAGLRGVPFVLPTLALLSMGVGAVSGDNNEPIDFARDMENMLPSFMTRGILSTMTGIDFSSRLGHQLPFYRDSIGGDTNLAKEYDNFILNHAGPLVGVGKNIARSLEAASNGRWMDALSAGPKPLANIANAAKLIDKGGYTDTKGAVISEAGAWTTLWQAVGYKSSEAKLAQDKQMRATSDVRTMQAQRAAILKQAADIVMAGGDVGSTSSMIDKFNNGVGATYPKARINADDISKTVQSLREHEKQIRITGIDVPKDYRR